MLLENLVVQSHIVPCQIGREYPGGAQPGAESSLRLCVKQYKPRQEIKANKDKSIVILSAGGNGFPKELYEPLWEDLVRNSCMHGYAIESIFIADMAHQGESGVLNEGKIGDNPSWFDYSRDMLQVVNCLCRGTNSKIVGIGHSMGATALVNLASFHPRLFSDLILIDPVLGYVNTSRTRDCTDEGVYFAHHTLRRLDTWPTLAIAKEWARKTPPYRYFDERVLQRWFDFALQPSRNGQQVRLTTSKHQEAITYVRPLFDPQANDEEAQHLRSNNEELYPDFNNKVVTTARNFYCPQSMAAFFKLAEIRSKVYYVFCGGSIMSPREKIKALLSRTGVGYDGSRARKVESIVLPGKGHLAIFEHVSEFAQVIDNYLQQALPADEHEGAVASLDLRTQRVSARWEREAAREVARIKAHKTKL